MKQSASDDAPKRGRPSQGKSGSFKFRVTTSLREKLEADAEAAGRPVSEIIEARLERSYQHSSIDPVSEGVARVAAMATAASQLVTGQMRPLQFDPIGTRYIAEMVRLEVANYLGVVPLGQLPEDERVIAAASETMAHEDFEKEIERRQKASKGFLDMLFKMNGIEAQPKS